MAESITYGTYTFPYPTPLVAEGVEPIYIQGEVDHIKHNIEIVGNLTGENLSGLHLQKMRMISGMLSEFQTLTITNNEANKQFTSAKPESINFDTSDLTTILPYSVSFSSYSEETFSEFFGIINPKDTWIYSEQDGRITEVSHSVSAQGVKVDSDPPLLNARKFVSGRATGCKDLSLFQTGAPVSAFLMSRTEDVNRSSNTYGINEVYKYNTTDNDLVTGISKSGVFTSSSKINFDKEGGLNVSLSASVQGSFNTGDGADFDDFSEKMLNTGVIDSNKAIELAMNAVANCTSEYESGLYTFIGKGPSTVSYNIDTGQNKIDFAYTFTDQENLDYSGNVLHTRSATVAASKDDSLVKVGIEGEFLYKGPDIAFVSGDAATGERFQLVEKSYSGLLNNSGFLNLAVEALQDFTGDATGYHISGNFINPEPLSKQITKDPEKSSITYNLEFDNRPDLASGTLSGLQINISDKRPIQLSGIVPSLGGFAKQNLINRRAGEYSVSASCEADTGDLQKLIEVTSGYVTGVYPISESSSLDDVTISYNIARFY